MIPPLPAIMVEPAVRAALLEDLGRAGDLTTDAIVPANERTECMLVARQAGVVAGLDFAITAFRLIDPAIETLVERPDGSRLAPGDLIAVIRGPARGVLTAERTALNFLCHLSGVASATRGIVDAITGTKAQVVCTRKTMPGLRAAQKYAVRVGGGSNHRFGLDDAVLIKDNHVAIAGGVRAAVERARTGVGHLVKIELEVDTLAQLQEAVALDVDAVLLDNMGPDRADSARYCSGDCGNRRRPAVGRLVDAQRNRARHRARSPGLVRTSQRQVRRHSPIELTKDNTGRRPGHRR
jgi:nicotinate-nucleotide pyrophosphorylase (carboxylating)